MAEDTLVLRVSNYLPFYYTNASGTWTGLSLEVVQTVAEKARINLKIENLPWSRAMMYIKSGKIDLMMNITRTNERE